MTPLAITVPTTEPVSVFCPAAQLPTAMIVALAPAARLPIAPNEPRLTAPPLATLSRRVTLVSATLPLLVTTNSYSGAGPVAISVGSPLVVGAATKVAPPFTDTYFATPIAGDSPV